MRYSAGTAAGISDRRVQRLPGTLRTTLGQDLGTINAENLRRAHRLLEERRAIGKLVLTGF